MRRIVRPHIQPHQTIVRVAKPNVKKIPIQGEKCHASVLVQQRNDFRVFHAKHGDIPPDEPEGNTPTYQQWQLVFRKIFVQ